MTIRMWHWCVEAFIGVHFPRCTSVHPTLPFWQPFTDMVLPVAPSTSTLVYHYCNSFLVVPSGCLLKRGSSEANWFLKICFRSWPWGTYLLSIIHSCLPSGLLFWTLLQRSVGMSLLSNSGSQPAYGGVLNSRSPAPASRQGICGGRSAAPRRRWRWRGWREGRAATTQTWAGTS